MRPLLCGLTSPSLIVYQFRHARMFDLHNFFAFRPQMFLQQIPRVAALS